MLWTSVCMGIIFALLGFSYRRLSALSELARWAAPYLARGGARVRGEDESDERRREMAELNEATTELGARLDQPGFIPKSCAKAAFSLGAFVALMQASQRLEGASAQTWSAPILSFAVGCGGAWGCWIIGRMAEERARRLRDDWNTLIRRFTRDVAT
jgi:hypothetical protein